MFMHYRSDYPNHVHQVGVTVSKHYYLGADGLLKYQQKPFEVKLNTLKQSPKRHLILLVVRDHTTGLFYGEAAIGPDLPSLESFLGRAWREKADFPFCGIPELLMLPKTVTQAFPGIESTMIAEGIRVIEPTSGYQSGALVSLRYLERDLCVAHIPSLGFRGTREDINRACRLAMSRNAKTELRGTKVSKLNVWLSQVPELRLPSDLLGKPA